MVNRLMRWYPIVDLSPDTWGFKRVDIEQVGSKEKFWFVTQELQLPHLFKYARRGTGEHWAEKIVAEVAVHLGIPAATVELAAYDGRPGVAVRSVLRFPPESQDPFEVLIHGNELLFERDTTYNKDFKRSYPSHTLDRIMPLLDSLATASIPGGQPLAVQFAGLIVLDALVGNTDRHHENWGLVRSEQGAITHVSPSFDHASSLGRELSDDDRERFLNSPGGIAHYIQRGHGAIFAGDAQGKPPSPLELAKNLAHRFPGAFMPYREPLKIVAAGDIMGIVDRIPPGSMSDPARQFAKAFLCYSLEVLQKL